MFLQLIIQWNDVIQRVTARAHVKHSHSLDHFANHAHVFLHLLQTDFKLIHFSCLFVDNNRFSINRHCSLFFVLNKPNQSKVSKFIVKFTHRALGCLGTFMQTLGMPLGRHSVVIVVELLVRALVTPRLRLAVFAFDTFGLCAVVVTNTLVLTLHLELTLALLRDKNALTLLTLKLLLMQLLLTQLLLTKLLLTLLLLTTLLQLLLLTTLLFALLLFAQHALSNHLTRRLLVALEFVVQRAQRVKERLAHRRAVEEVFQRLAEMLLRQLVHLVGRQLPELARDIEEQVRQRIGRMWRRLGVGSGLFLMLLRRTRQLRLQLFGMSGNLSQLFRLTLNDNMENGLLLLVRGQVLLEVGNHCTEAIDLVHLGLHLLLKHESVAVVLLEHDCRRGGELREVVLVGGRHDDEALLLLEVQDGEIMEALSVGRREVGRNVEEANGGRHLLGGGALGGALLVAA